MARARHLVGLIAVLPISVGVAALAAPYPALASAQPTSSGTPLAAIHGVMAKAVGEDLGTIMARDRLAGPQQAPAVPIQRSQPNRAGLPPNPDSSRVSAKPDPEPALRAGLPSVAQTIGTQLMGAQVSESGSVPPDSMGAVGPSQFIVIVNGRIKSFNKTTGVVDGILNSSTDSFFASVRHGLPTSDPRVRYDRLSGRWFFSMITAAFPNHVLIAYSDAGTIGAFAQIHFLFYDVNLGHAGCLWDYDTLGIDQNALYIGGNLYCGASPGTFTGTRGLVVPKAAVVAGGAVQVTDFGLGGDGSACPGVDGVFTPQGVDNYDPASTVGYFAGTSLCVFSKLTFARISNPGGSPSGVLLGLPVAGTMFPSAVPAMGSTHPLDALDDRLFAAHLRNGHLWTAHNLCVDTSGVAVPNSCPAGTRTGSRWYDITNLDSTPAVNQTGTVFDPTASNPRNYWIPSMMVSGQGHVAMGTSAAGTTEHAEAATMGRLAGDAPGTMQAATIYQASTFDYNAQANPVSGIQRWGDFSYTSLDPNDDMTMWTIQEFANATNSWGVEAVQLKAPPPATPSATGPGPNYANQCSVTVSVTGTSTAGSGFYDPGAGFANRIQASVSGGVTVNHVTYVDPTHVTLDVSTQGAAPGAKDVTITNPDGQSVTGTGVLTVLAAVAAPGIMSATSSNQYSLANSDGATWQEIDPALRLPCAPVANQDVLLTANVDLFTGAAGYNQDVGIFVSTNGGGDQLLAWKESGGFAGTYSPNAAYVQFRFQMASSNSYVFKLKWKTNKNAPGATIYAAAGPGPFPWSQTTLVGKVFPPGAGPNWTYTPQQYHLTSSDGATWQDVDVANLQSQAIIPGANSTAVLGANVDLFTGTAGYNQDIGIFVSDNGGTDSLVAWKESGGFAGTYSPNAAFVKATYPMTSGHTYIFKLKWKTNKPAPGATIYAAAGPGPFPWSETSLVEETIPGGSNLYYRQSVNQYSFAGSDGAFWQSMDLTNNLDVTVGATANTNAIVGANVDLFTGAAGFNQDIGIFVNVDSAVNDTLLVWKESGGFAGTYSPNAAFAQTTYHMLNGHTYVFKLKWKTNKNAPGATIYAAAGPGPSPWSNTRLTVEQAN